jgi:hypothetical protein
MTISSSRHPQYTRQLYIRLGRSGVQRLSSDHIVDKDITITITHRSLHIRPLPFRHTLPRPRFRTLCIPTRSRPHQQCSLAVHHPLSLDDRLHWTPCATLIQSGRHLQHRHLYNALFAGRVNERGLTLLKPVEV